MDYSQLPLPKGAKGDSFKERRQRRRAIVNAEDHAKAEVRRRDRICRWPKCENCRTYKPRLEVAHLRAKGAGGTSRPEDMILLDYLTHQGGANSVEQHGKMIVPLTDQGTSGPCAFWQRDKD